DMSELNNKVAVITGAGSGIGEAIAKALSQHGVNIALAGRNEEKLQTVAQQLETETKVIPTDVTQKDSVDQMLQVVKG
ncbi:SDR family NAD(P)-dependent oxidoreductase, partial [Staphylococcus hominis]